MNRAAAVHQVAPIAPPCFSARDQWVEYLVHAAEYQRKRHPGPLGRTVDGEPTFNFKFNFCSDCTDTHRTAMVAQERCQPSYLIRIEPAKPIRVAPAVAEAAT